MSMSATGPSELLPPPAPESSTVGADPRPDPPSLDLGTLPLDKEPSRIDLGDEDPPSEPLSIPAGLATGLEAESLMLTAAPNGAKASDASPSQIAPAKLPKGSDSSTAEEKPSGDPALPPSAAVLNAVPGKGDSLAYLKPAKEPPTLKPMGPPPSENVVLAPLLGALEPSVDAPALLLEAFEGELTNWDLAVG